MCFPISLATMLQSYRLRIVQLKRKEPLLRNKLGEISGSNMIFLLNLELVFEKIRKDLMSMPFSINGSRLSAYALQLQLVICVLINDCLAE